MWYFVCGSEFRARWHDWIEDSREQEKSHRNVSKCRLCRKCQLSLSNTLQASKSLKKTF
jgi:hypothetical protein